MEPCCFRFSKLVVENTLHQRSKSSTFDVARNTLFSSRLSALPLDADGAASLGPSCPRRSASGDDPGMRRVLGVALLAAVSVGVASASAPGAATNFDRSTASVSCDVGATRRTVVILDGVLYGDVQQGRRFLFGWSDWPVLDFQQKLRLIRLLGLKGSAQQLLTLPSIRGGDFADQGSYSNLSVRCAGVYHASFVTRSFGPARFSLSKRLAPRSNEASACPLSCSPEERG